MSDPEGEAVDPSEGYYTRSDGSGIERGWFAQSLWLAAEGLPVRSVPLAEIDEVRHHESWFHVYDDNEERRIEEADLAYPIILSADGHVMDGFHRLRKAVRLGLTEIQAVRFETDPYPDWEGQVSDDDGEADGGA